MTDDPILEELAETLEDKKGRGRQPKQKTQETSKPYRTSGYSVVEFCHLPYARRATIDRECDEQAGLTYTTHEHSLDKPYTVGLRTKARPEPIISLTKPIEPVMNQPKSVLTQPTSQQFLPPPAMPASRPAHQSAVPAATSRSISPADIFAELSAEVAASANPVPYTTEVKSVTIYQTTDYDQFKLLDENRRIDLNHVRVLKALIAENNQLHAEPLDVSPNMEVLDGQHRLRAARELGLPVFFRYTDQSAEDALKTMNKARKNWQGIDWLHHYTVKGLPSYVALTAFRERHPRLSFSNAKMMLSGSAHNGAPEFRAGKWTKADETKAELVAQFIEYIDAETPFKSAMHTGFVAAVYHCVANIPGFDLKEFRNKIEKQPRALVTCASHKQYLAMFDEIYNYRTYEANKVRFL